MIVDPSNQELIDNSFIVPAPCRFKLGNIRGRVEIQAGEDSVIQVIAVKHLGSGDAPDTRIEMSQAEDGSVSVETHYDQPLGWLFFNRGPCKVDYTVRLPRTCALQISGVSSSAFVQSLDGVLEFSTVSGRLTLKDLSGELMVKSVSGKVEGENLSGELKLETVSGNVRLVSCRFSSLHGSTVSAALEIQTPLSDGPYRFRSVSGDVRLTVPQGTGCTLTSHSFSGKIVSNLYTTRRQVNAGQQVVDVQGGGPEVHYSSISGDLRLFVSDEMPAAVPVDHVETTAPAPEVPSFPDRWEVLERIDRGELTAEEALRILAS
jgi:hypothetical protein